MNKETVQVHEFVAHSTKVNCVAVGPKSTQVIATGGEDWKINIWRVGTVNNIWSLGHNKAPIECLCFDSDENCIVSGSLNGSVKVYDLNEGKLARNLGTHQTNVTSVQFHPYGEFLVTGSADNTMKFWDVRNKSCVETYSGHKKEITCVRFSPDGKWVASAGKDGQILFYDLIASKHINTIRIAPAYATAFEFNPTEFSLAASTSQRSVRLWDLETMKSTYSTPPEAQLVKAISFSNLGNELFLAAKSSLKIWDIENTFRQSDALEMGWDNMDVGDMKILNNDQMVAVGFNRNSSFVSVYEVDLSDYIGHGIPNDDDEEGERGGEAEEEEEQEEEERTEMRRSNSIDNPETAVPVVSRTDRSPREGVTPRISSSSKVRSEYAEKPQPQSKEPDISSDYRNNIQRRMKDDHFSSNDDYLAPSKPGGRPPAPGRKESPAGDWKGLPEDSDLKDSSDTDEKIVPSVQPGEGYSNDMATSMGDSFWRRFKESQAQQAEAIKISTALEQMLPPSGFDDHFESVGVAASQKSQPKVNSTTPTGLSSKASQSNPSEVKAAIAAAVAPFSSPSSNNNNSNSNNPPALKVLSRRETNRPASGNAAAALYQQVNYGNIQDIETKGIEGLAIVGSNRHMPQVERRPEPQLVLKGEETNDKEKCYDSVNKLLQQSELLTSHLQQRLTQLKILRNTWRKGDVFIALDILQDLLKMAKDSHTASTITIPGQIQNLYIVADFFSAMNLQHQHLTLDACVRILPLLEEMMIIALSSQSGAGGKSSAETVVGAVYKSLVGLGQAFGELIRSTRSAIVVVQRGVDLSREARLEKCNECFEFFQKGKQRIEMMKYQYRHHSEVVEVLEQYSKLCQQYF